jgi:hypothetical protein
LKKNMPAKKPKREPLKIYRIVTGDDGYTSPSSKQTWLVQAATISEALQKSVAKMKWLENSNVSIEPLGALAIK